MRRLAQGIYELPGGSGRLTSMEGMRGLAVLLVFFVHFYALFGLYGRGFAPLWQATRFMGVVGNSGVDIFFVLSGFLIYGALIRHRTQMGGFLRRRVQRIYPTFLAVFVLYLLLSGVFPQFSKLHGRTLGGTVVYVVENLLLLPGMVDIAPMITVAWSLSYEFFFYISVTLVVGALGMWRWRPVTRVATVSALGLAYLAVCFSTPTSHVRMLMFLVGILLYEALLSRRFTRLLTRRGEIAAIALFAGSIAFGFVQHAWPDLFSVLPGWSTGRNAVPGVMVYYGPYKTIALAIGTFWCGAYCFAFEGRLKRAFSWAPLRYLGNMSYSYYLIHGVTMQAVALAWGLIAARGAASMPLFLTGLVVSLAAAWISSTALFLLVEKPSSFARRRAIPAMAVAAPTGVGS